MRVTGRKIRKMVMAACHGSHLTKNTKVNGKVIFLMERGHTFGTRQSKRQRQ